MKEHKEKNDGLISISKEAGAVPPLIMRLLCAVSGFEALLLPQL